MNFQELYETGYRQGEPYWGLIDDASIDRQVCAESKCDRCEHQGMEYKPFIRDNPRSYRAFAVCPECRDCQEF